MIIVLALLIFFPVEYPWFHTMVFGGTYREAIQSFSTAWVFLSPFWALTLVLVSYWYGKSIEVIDNAKLAISLVNEHKHRAIPVLSFLKRLIKRG